MTVATDVTLLVLATARLTRLLTVDTITDWLLHERMWRLLARGPHHIRNEAGERAQARIEWYDALMACPHCIGWWLSGAMLLLLVVAGGPGDAASWWRYGSGLFALSYVVGHVSDRLDGDH